MAADHQLQQQLQRQQRQCIPEFFRSEPGKSQRFQTRKDKATTQVSWHHMSAQPRPHGNGKEITYDNMTLNGFLEGFTRHTPVRSHTE